MPDYTLKEKITSLIVQFQKKTGIVDSLLLQREGLFFKGSRNDPTYTEIIPAMIASIMNTGLQMQEVLEMEEAFTLIFQGKKRSICTFPLGEKFFLVLIIKSQALNRSLKRYISRKIRNLNRWLETQTQ